MIHYCPLRRAFSTGSDRGSGSFAFNHWRRGNVGTRHVSASSQPAAAPLRGLLRLPASHVPVLGQSSVHLPGEQGDLCTLGHPQEFHWTVSKKRKAGKTSAKSCGGFCFLSFGIGSLTSQLAQPVPWRGRILRVCWLPLGPTEVTETPSPLPESNLKLSKEDKQPLAKF